MNHCHKSADLFTAVDRYIDELFVSDDPASNPAFDFGRDRGLPQHQVSPNQGKLLYLFARLIGAQRILELGTLAGYSSVWLARALPDGGSLMTLECDPLHAEIAHSNLAHMELGDKVEILVGPALKSLSQIAGRGNQTFDLVFLDADKINYPAYLDWAVRLTRPGGLILADNIIREGAILTPLDEDDAALGAADFNEKLARDPRLEAVILQQVGAKGHDGLAIARVKECYAASRIRDEM